MQSILFSLFPSIMIDPKQNIDSNVLPVISKFLKQNVTSEGGLTLPLKVKSKLQREFLKFHNNLPSCEKEDGSRSDASVETDSFNL